MELALFGALAVGGVAALRTRRVRQLHTHCRDQAAFAAKREALIAGGPDKLHVVIDFDRTITCYFGADGKQGQSCHGIVESRRSDELKARAEAYNQVYYPLETSPDLTREQKIPLMVQWYEKIHGLLVTTGLSRRTIAEDVAHSNARLRGGVAELLDWSRARCVPVTIFSAGIGDVLEEVLRQRYGPLPPLCRVVSNRMVFAGPEPDAPIADFSSPCIHMFSKYFTRELHATLPWLPSLATRPNVLLVGDGLGDVTMADGLPAVDTVLRVGFLNDRIDRLLGKYAEAFDVVTLGDRPAWEVTDLLREMDLAHRR